MSVTILCVYMSYMMYKKGVIMRVGESFPQFKLVASVASSDFDVKTAFKTITNQTYSGKWLIVFFYPKDFTFVCPTEIAAFAQLNDAFVKKNAQILGASIDSDFVHLAWRRENAIIGKTPFPILSDIKRELATQLNIIDSESGVTQRATYIVDPTGKIRFTMVTDMQVGRNAEEVLRVLAALQTNGFVQCNWKDGEETLKI